MKKIFTLLALFLLFIYAGFGQTFNSYFAETDHYMVYADSDRELAEKTADTLEGLLELYNSYFHFHLDELEYKFTVRIKADKSSFDDYLQLHIEDTVNDFVYLHYGDAEKRELVCFEKPGVEFNKSLAHQGFIQFLKAYVTNPPIWIREGFAILFESFEIDPSTGKTLLTTNTDWLETIKSIVKGEKGSSIIEVERFLGADISEFRANSKVYYPQAWGFVTFLLNHDKKMYTRILADAVNALEISASESENTKAVLSDAFSWYDMIGVQYDFTDYILSQKTFNDYINQGVAAYSAKDYESGETAFYSALDMKKDHHVPYYYLGLIYFSQKDYAQAEYFYLIAKEYSAPGGVIHYALGLNAYAAGDIEKARGFLIQAKIEAPVKYGDKVDGLLERMK